MKPLKISVAAAILACLFAAAPAVAADAVDPLGLLPEKTSVLVKVNFKALAGSDAFRYVKEIVPSETKGLEKLIRETLDEAQISPFAKHSDEDESSLAYVTEVYLAKAGLDDSEDDTVALVVGRADLGFTLKMLQDRPGVTIKTPKETGGKYYEVRGLVAKDETLFMAQLKGAIGVARTKAAVLGFLDRESGKKEGAKGIRRNKSLIALANKVFNDDSVVSVIAVIDEEARKKFAAENSIEARYLQTVKNVWFRIDPVQNKFQVTSRWECTDKKAAENLETTLKILCLKALLSAKEPEIKNFFKAISVAISEGEKEIVDVKFNLNAEEIKIFAFGPEKKEEGKEKEKKEIPEPAEDSEGATPEK